jgi:hypothetical protein
MPGLVVPSILERKMQATRATLAQIGDRSKFDERGVHSLGNGMSVTKSGAIVLERRSAAPSQAETEDMRAVFEKFRDWLKSEGAGEMATEKSGAVDGAIVEKANDPILRYPAALTPADFSFEFGTPIDTTELLTLCEETSMYEALPEVVNGSNTESWRESASMFLASGTASFSFAAGDCPSFVGSETGTLMAVAKKHVGIMSTLTESDIQHSIASIAAGYGVRELLGPINAANSMDIGREAIRSLMDKEIKKQSILMLNGLDSLLVKGNAASITTEFTGIENYVTGANGARVNPSSSAYSGTFNAQRFDEWLSAGVAKPTHLYSHPTTLQALKTGYWGLGASSGPAQILNFTGPAREVVPGLTFADTIMTSIGELVCVPNTRFSRTNHGDGSFSAKIYALRMAHNGEPLIYRATQIPLSYKELPPGCSAVQFMTWAVTALVIKWMKAQAVYTAKFQGLVDDGCTYVFGS